MRYMLRAAALLPVLALATGCHVSFTSSHSVAMSKSQVEEKLTTSLKEETGKSDLDPVTCPGDLDGKVGVTMKCTLDYEGRTIDVDVKVTGVDGDNVKFDYETSERAKR